MLISNNFGARIAIFFFLINVSTSKPASDSQCNWKEDVDCWLLCSGGYFTNVTLSVEEKWTERPQCHAEGIALGLFGIFYMNFTVTANWFQAKVKVNYLEFGTGWVNEMEDNAFNADAFKSVKHLTIPKMDLYEMKKGLFNGLGSLEKLNLMDTSLVRSVDMGILDGLNQTLKVLTIEGNNNIQRLLESGKTLISGSPPYPLTIESFTGSQQTLTLEYIRVRYYLQRLISKSFLSLKNIKHLDVSYCGIEYIEEGAFDPVIGSIRELQLTGNKIKKFPAWMLDLVPLMFMGKDTGCKCSNLKSNFIVKIDCKLESNEAEKFCSSPTGLITTTTITANTPTTVLTSSTNEETSYPPTQHDSTTNEVIYTSTALTSSTSEESSIPPTQTDSTTSEVIYPSTVPTSSSTILKAEVKEFKSGDVILYVYVSKEHSKVFLDFSDEETRIGYIREINCPISTSNSRCSVTVTNLKGSSNYTFCVIDNPDETTERLCIHYTTRGSPYLQLWFVKISSTMIVVMAAMMCILLVLICFIAFLSKN